MRTEEQMNVIAGLDEYREAVEILDTFKTQAHNAAHGSMVIPDWVPSWQIVLEYARLRLLAVALMVGDAPEAVSALASAPSMATRPSGQSKPANGSPLILPGR